MEASGAPDRSTIGLCFSGGGCRASFYALSILRYLAEAGLLGQVTAISAASRGSIATAAAADRWTQFEEAGGGVDAFLDNDRGQCEDEGRRLPQAGAATVSLVDGGVYDNLGLEWFQGEDEESARPASARERPFTIVANASGLFAEKNKRFWSLGSIGRDVSIRYQQSLNVRIRWWVERLQAGAPGVYFAIKNDPRKEPRLDPAVDAAALPSELVPPLARLRTDLDRFSTQEAGLLSYMPTGPCTRGCARTRTTWRWRVRGSLSVRDRASAQAP